jgi:dolichol-phosphate mannosyltransferase
MGGESTAAPVGKLGRGIHSTRGRSAQGARASAPPEDSARPPKRPPRRRPALSVVVPTKNEAGNIARLLAELEAVLPDEPVEVVFVDDSTDETPAAIETEARRCRRHVTLVHRPPGEREGGLGGAVVAGIRASRAPWICVMDGDLQHPPAVIGELVEAARERDLDLVVASRYCKGGESTALAAGRVAASKAASGAAHLLFPWALRNVSDPMTGFFLVRRDALDLDLLQPRGFKILLEILVRTPGLRVGEVPFSFGTRHAGESKASLREGLTYFGRLATLRLGSGVMRLARFGLVGASGLVVNLLAFLAFAELAGFHYVLAAILATQTSTLWNFLLTERWVFTDRDARHSRGARAVLFFAMNNIALALRVPALVVLVAGLGLNEALANLLTLVGLTLVRFAISDTWIWGEHPASPRRVYRYLIHGVVSVESPVRLRELERFRVAQLGRRPTIRVQLGRLTRAQSEMVSSLSFMSRHIRYDEGMGRLGFGIEIAVGKSIEILASPLLRYSPHVLYTNAVEPVLRWTFVKKGYALAHGACIAHDGRAYLVTAATDTGKTTTVLKTLYDYPCEFISDDLTLVGPDGQVLTYPKPLTISRHTVHAVKAPLRAGERLALCLQSRLHSRSGRQFALMLARTGLPVATINGFVQLLVPPPKYDVTRLVPGVELTREARLAGLVVIERGGVGSTPLETSEAVEILVRNTDDAYGFPPYPFIEQFLNRPRGRDLRDEERRILADALAGVPAVVLRSETMDWCERLAALVIDARARVPAIAPVAEPAPLEAAAPVFR